MTEFISTKQRKARTEHACHMCGKKILSGCEYVHQSYKSEGCRIETLKRHIHCDAMLDVYLQDLCLENEYNEQEVLEELIEYSCKTLCSEEQRDDCFEDPTCIYGCEIAQAHLLTPTVLAAAKQSVRDNTDWEYYDG